MLKPRLPLISPINLCTDAVIVDCMNSQETCTLAPAAWGKQIFLPQSCKHNENFFLVSHGDNKALAQKLCTNGAANAITVSNKSSKLTVDGKRM